MGNCLSASDPGPLGVIVNRLNTADTQLTSDQIKQALNSVAASLKAKSLNISIVAVGGAVNTLLLKSRTTTGDVDFFYRTKTTNEDVTQVIVAADIARKALKLDEHWLNNHTALFIQVRLSI